MRSVGRGGVPYRVWGHVLGDACALHASTENGGSTYLAPVTGSLPTRVTLPSSAIVGKTLPGE